MKLTAIISVILIVFVLLMGCTAPHAQYYSRGGSGGGNITATIDVNYTFTGLPGSNALVINRGNDSVALLDFFIPRGINGTDGANGINGVNGTNGVNGADGATGPMGPTGPPGPKGDTGAANMTAGSAATIGVNYTFTAPQGENANVVNVGTSSAALLDFSIPQGIMNQTPNMTAGVPGATGGVGGQTLYFNHATSSTIPGYEGLQQLPSGDAEVDESVTVRNALGEVIVDPYITLVGQPGVASLPAGLWQFRTYHYVNSASGTTTAIFKVYNRTVSGTETLLFTATSDDINSLTVNQYTTNYVQASSYPVSLTDRIVVKVYGQTTHSANIIFHFVYQGSVHTSNIQTPVTISDASTLTFSAIADSGAGGIKKGQAVYISGASGSNPVVALTDNTVSAKTRVVGLMVSDTAFNGLGQVRRSGILTEVDTRATNSYVNPLGQTWTAGDLLFATTGGGLTNVRPTSGRTVKAAYTLLGSNADDVLLSYPMENPVWVAGAQGEDVILRLGDNTGTNKVSIRNYTNGEVAWVNSIGEAYFNNSIGINTTSPSELLDINGNKIRIRLNKTPSSSSDFCYVGTIAWDENYIYICTSNNNWKRSGLSSW